MNAGAISGLARSRARADVSETGARRRHIGASGLPADALRMTSVKSTHVMPESSSNSRSRPASATGTCIPAGPRPPSAIAEILQSSSTKQRDSAVLQQQGGGRSKGEGGMAVSRISAQSRRAAREQEWHQGPASQRPSLPRPSMWNSRRLSGESGAVNRPAARGAAAVGSLAGFLVAAEDGANRANDAVPRQEEPQRCSSATAAALQAAEESAMAAANAARFEAYRRGEGVRAVEAAAARAAKKAREAAAALPVRAPALQGFSELELARRSSVNSSAGNFAAPAKDAHVSGPSAASSAPKDAGKGLASMLGVEEDESGAGGRSVATKNKANQKRTYSQVYSALEEMSRPALKEAKIEPSKASRQDGKPQTDDGKPKMKKVFVLGANKV